MRSKSVIIGLCFIVLGVLIGLASFDIIDFDLFFPGWWTLFIIVPSVMGLICDGDKTWSLVGLFIGTFFFLSCQPFFDFDTLWKLFIPCILVICGFNIMFKKNNKVIPDKNMSAESENKEEVKEETKEEIILEKKTNKEYYKEDNILNISTIFKSTTTDLSERKFKNNDIIKVSSIFGDNKIYLPSNINVKIKSGILFGSVYNDKVENEDNKVTVIVDCGILFGSVTIKEK